MSYIATELPRRIAAGFRGGPEWKTSIVRLDNGREARNKDWAYGRYRYVANFGAFNEADRTALVSLFHAAGGRFAAFLFRDPTDCVASGESISPSIGTTTPVQLKKTYAFGAASQVSLIQAPVAATVIVYKDGSPVTVTVDPLTGLVTPSGNWAAGTYTWSGQFCRWVRFDSDWGAFTANALGVWVADIDLVEVRR